MPPSGTPHADLERALGYCFGTQELLATALTHRSAGRHHNERLEFLGDALLGYVVAEELYRLRPEAREGELTRLRAALVRRETLAAIAAGLGLGARLRLGEGELKSGGWRRESTLANALEAVIAAVYLDGGIDACRTVILRLLGERLQQLPAGEPPKDPKTRLQEHLQAHRLALPVYEIVTLQGEPHAQRFTVRCTVTGSDLPPAVAAGTSRRSAEQEAARLLLIALGEEPETP